MNTLCTGLLSACLYVAGLSIAAGAVPGERNVVPSIGQAIRIDGRLDEPQWRKALIRNLNYQFQPGGIPRAPVRTRVYLLSDMNYLYVAYHAFDPNPAEIRAHLDGRDHALHDDYVGMMLDTFHDRRRAYEFLANPLGVQIDAYRNEVTGNEDAAFNAIWLSAGRIVDDGYIVEIAIPFRQLRFADNSSAKTWGLFLFRNYPRDVRHQLADIPVDINRDCLVCQERVIVGMADASPGHDLQVTPTLTAARTDTRETRNSALESGNDKTEAGLDVRWGITPSDTLSATINPDFSTVELDIPQLQVNNQFALFYPERRPFFLEGAAHFDSPMQVVYTRTVGDPAWGVKLTGRSGRNSYGLFTAQDNLTNVIFPGPEYSVFASYPLDTRDTALRYQRDLGENSAAGVIATQRIGGPYRNNLVGVDGRFLFNDTDQMVVQYLHSDTRYSSTMAAEAEHAKGPFADDAYQILLERNAKNYDLHTEYDSLGRDFRADMGYIYQVGIDQLAGGGGYKWYGGEADWFTQHGFDIDWQLTHFDTGAVLDRRVQADYFVKAGWQSNVKLTATQAETVFNARSFDRQFVSLHGEMQPTNGVYLAFDGQTGDGIDYANTRPGTLRRLSPTLGLQLGRHLRTELRGTLERFDEAAGHLYTARLLDFRVYYQFDLRTQLRLITQYQDVRRNTGLYLDPATPARQRGWGSQLLFSYKLNPRTVLYAGYASGYTNDEADSSLYLDRRTLFLKLSYAWQL